MVAEAGTKLSMSRRARLLVAAAFGLLVGGCSLLLSTAEPTQCSTTRDCDTNPAFRNRVCKEGFCVEDTPVVTDAGGSGCVSTEQCTALNSGRVSICKKVGGACTPWQTEQCKLYAGSLTDPNAVVIGSIMPFTARQMDGRLRLIPYADRVRRAADLAVKDFEAQQPGGAFMPDGKRRPFAILHCDSQLSSSGALSAFNHLTDVVGVNAMIVASDNDLAAVAAEAASKRVAIACSDCRGPLPPGPLAWRIGPRLALEAPMAAWRVAGLESEIMAGPNPPAAVKVAVLKVPDSAFDGFYAALVEKLRLNGKTVSESGSNFLAVETEDPLVKAVDHAKHVAKIVAFDPDVIIVMMGQDFPDFYIDMFESTWPTGKRRPKYVLTSLNFGASSFVSALDDIAVRRRVSGTRPAHAAALQANIDAFSTRYLPANNFQQPDGNQSGFDAFYAMAFAVLAARTQPLLDGPHISAGFERLRGGTTLVDFRPERIGIVTAMLADPGASIDVRGLWSDLDWNVATRDFDSDVGMYCFIKDSGGGLTLKLDAGPRLTTSTGVVTGTYSCE